MNSSESLLESLYCRLGGLSGAQYRAVCFGILVCGILGLSQSLSGLLTVHSHSVTTDHREPDDLHTQREVLRAELIGLERRLFRYRSGEGEGEVSISERREDVVHVIDRASRDASVRVLDLVTARVARDARIGYQLTVRGGYRGIVELVARIVEYPSPVVVSEVAIHAPDWTYPGQPLQAKLLLEVYPTTRDKV